MGLIKTLGRYAWRKFALDGVSSSGFHKPEHPDIFAFIDKVDEVTAALSAAGSLKGEWDASSGLFPGAGVTAMGDTWLVTEAGTTGGRFFAEGDRIVALVVNASTSVFTANWGVIPANARTVVVGVDAGTGAANAIQVTTEDAVANGTVVIFSLFRDTTGSPVKVSINGGPLLTAVTNRDNNASGLTAGMEIWGRYRASDSTFRLLNDQDVSALVAQAEEARDDAIAAAAGVSNLISIFDTEAIAAATVISAAVNAVIVSGGESAGDGLGRRYIDTPNGRPVAFTSSGGTARNWYKEKAVEAASYVGQVATRCVIPGFSNLTYKQIMSRTRHLARDSIHGVKLVYPNWFHNGNTETGIDGSITVTASIEYPAGEFHQVKWSGSTPVVVADRTNSAASDEVAVEIPEGAEFWVRTYSTSAAGIVFSGLEDTANGEGAEFAESGITDKTMSGTITNSGTSAVYGPCAIIGSTTKPSVLIVGDSRESAVGFDAPNNVGSAGHIARAIAQMCGYINVARGGERLAEFVASASRRLALAQYCSHVVIHMGINDLTAGTSAAAVLADLNTTIGYFDDQEVWVATIEPVTTSSDSWATVANQTVDATSNANRISVNNSIRAGLSGVAGYFDIADVFESSRDSGKWKAPSGVALTSDGTHQTVSGYEWGEQSGIIDPNAFFDTGTFRPRFASREEVRAGKSAGLLVSPASIGPRPKFKATKTADQIAIGSAASTKVTWGAVDLDAANAFSLANSRWTPPAGVYRLRSQLYATAGIVDAAQFLTRIAKNGVTVAETSFRPNGTAGQTVVVEGIFEANGEDYFEVWVNWAGTGDKTIDGSATKTYFEGFEV